MPWLYAHSVGKWDALLSAVLGTESRKIAATMAELNNVVSSMCAIPVVGMPPLLRQHCHQLVDCMDRIHRAATEMGSNGLSQADSERCAGV